MATFGKFIAEEQPWNGARNVFLARQKGYSGEPNVVLKLYPRVVARTKEAEARELAARGAALQLHHEAARNQERYVAALLEYDVTQDGIVWQVTQRYAASLDAYIQGLGSKPAPARTTWHVCLSVVTGALSIQLADSKSAPGARRSHGNLKLTNILLADPSAAPSGDVVVCDPAPGSPGDAGEFELRDLEDIGRALYQLVTGRKVATEPEWAGCVESLAKAGPEWKVFGNRRAEWVTLCASLLQVRSSSKPTSLRGLEENLRKLEPVASRGTPWALIGASVLVIALASIAFWKFRKQETPGTIPWMIVTTPEGAEAEVVDAATGVVLARGKTPLLSRLTGLGPGTRGISRVSFTNELERLLGASSVTSTVPVVGGVTNRFEFPHGFAEFEIPRATGRKVRVWRTANLTNELFSDALPLPPRRLPPGEYQVRLSADGLRPWTTNFIVKATETTRMTVELMPMREGELEIQFTSDLPKATRFYSGNDEIKVYGYFIHSTTNEITVRPPPPWELFTNRLALGPNGILESSNRVFKVTAPNGLVQLDVQSEAVPSAAEVRVRRSGRPQGLAGLWTSRDVPFVWPPGEVEVEVVADGYETNRFVLSISLDATTNYVVTLKPLYGTVMVSANLEGALLMTNGVSLGALGVEPRPVRLPPGATHTLRAVFTNEMGELDPVEASVSVRPAGLATNLFPFAFGQVELSSATTNTEFLLESRPEALKSKVRYQRPGQVLRYSAVAEHFDRTNFPVQVAALQKLDYRIVLKPTLYPLLTVVGPREGTLLDVRTGQPWVVGATNVPWGTYLLSLHYPGLGTVVTNITTESNRIASQVWWLPHGRVRVATRQPGLKVRVDGVDRPELTPIPSLILPAGVHEFEFAQDNFNGKTEKRSATVQLVTAGQEPEAIQSLVYDDVQFLPPSFSTATPAASRIVLQRVGDFYVGQFEITRAQFNAVLGVPLTPDQETPVDGGNARDLPATTVGAGDLPLVNAQNIERFCQRLTEAEAPGFRVLGDGRWVFGLPTRQEWQLATATAPKAGANLGTGALMLAGRAGGPRSQEGIQDLFGNAAELLKEGDSLLIVGGSYNNQPNDPIEPRAISAADGANGFDEVGFRVVLRRQ